MKRLIASILAVLYLGISSGATVELHYCMGQLINWSLSSSSVKESCSNCGMSSAEAKKCCKEEVKQLKIEKHRNIAQDIFQFTQDFLKAPSALFPKNSFHTGSALPKSSFNVPPSPPGLEKLPSFLRHRALRI